MKNDDCGKVRRRGRGEGGDNYLVTAAATILPKICAILIKPPRTYDKEPTRHIAAETAGLNNPPEMRKKAHALTARLNPNASEIYKNLAGPSLPGNELAT